jgi:hypothetical protein
MKRLFVISALASIILIRSGEVGALFSDSLEDMAWQADSVVLVQYLGSGQPMLRMRVIRTLSGEEKSGVLWLNPRSLFNIRLMESEEYVVRGHRYVVLLRHDQGLRSDSACGGVNIAEVRRGWIEDDGREGIKLSAFERLLPQRR